MVPQIWNKRNLLQNRANGVMRLQSIKPSLHIKQNAAEQMKMKHISPTKNETFSPKYAVTDLGLESKKKQKTKNNNTHS